MKNNYFNHVNVPNFQLCRYRISEERTRACPLKVSRTVASQNHENLQATLRCDLFWAT